MLNVYFGILLCKEAYCTTLGVGSPATLWAQHVVFCSDFMLPLSNLNTFLPWQCFYGLTAQCGKFHRRANIYKKWRFKRVWSRHLRHICYQGLQLTWWDHIRLGNEIEWSRTPDSTLLIHGQIKSDTDRGAGCCTVNHGHSKKTHMVDSVLHDNVLTNQSLNLNFVQWRL